MSVLARILLLTTLVIGVHNTPLPAEERLDVDSVFEETEEVDSQLAVSIAPEEAAEPVPAEEVDEVKALLQRLDTLEKAEKKRTAGEAKKAADEKAKKEAEAAKAEDWVDLSTDKWTVKLGGHVQMDYVDWANADSNIPAADSQNYFAYRRLRLTEPDTGFSTFVCK